eukprot:sb/3466121/
MVFSLVNSTKKSDNDAANYIVGVFMVVCFLISTILNPLIFYAYTKRKKTIQNFLFKTIALTDLATNLVPALFCAYICFSDYKFSRSVFLTQIPDFLCCTFGCISQVTTTMLAVTRTIGIVQPFLRVKFRLVLAYLICYAVYMALGNGGSLVLTGLLDFTENPNENLIETLHHLNSHVCFLMNTIHCVIGVSVSLVTCSYLRWLMVDCTNRKGKLRSCTTIVIMNIPYVISIVTNLVAYFGDSSNFKLVNHFLLPILTSAFNPCVIVSRTRGLLNPVFGRGAGPVTNSKMDRSMVVLNTMATGASTLQLHTLDESDDEQLPDQEDNKLEQEGDVVFVNGGAAVDNNGVKKEELAE